MGLTLSPSQIELNCRRIHLYDFDNLTRDEWGTLHPKPNWTDWIPFMRKDEAARGLEATIPTSNLRDHNIKPVILETLNGVCKTMNQTPPITFYILPCVDIGLHGYEKVAQKVQVSSSFLWDVDILTAMEQVLSTYRSVDHRLCLSSDIPGDSHTSRMINRFVTSKIQEYNPHLITLEDKWAWAYETSRRIEKQLNQGKIWDNTYGIYRDLNWLFSGAWEKAETGHLETNIFSYT